MRTLLHGTALVLFQQSVLKFYFVRKHRLTGSEKQEISLVGSMSFIVSFSIYTGQSYSFVDNARKCSTNAQLFHYYLV